MNRLLLLALSIYLSSATSKADVKSWPQWRGPDASGHAFEGKFPAEWSANKNLIWKTSLPGRGHSSAVHENGLIWITTALETPASEKEKQDQNEEFLKLTELEDLNFTFDENVIYFRSTYIEGVLQ